MSGALLLLGLWSVPQDEDEIRDAIRSLESEFLDERQAALKLLESAGKKAEPYLIESINASDVRVRVHSIRLLAKMKSKEPVNVIGAHFESSAGVEVRESAVEHVSSGGDSGTVAPGSLVRPSG